MKFHILALDHPYSVSINKKGFSFAKVAQGKPGKFETGKRPG